MSNVKKSPFSPPPPPPKKPVTLWGRVTGWSSSFSFLGHRRRRIMWPLPFSSLLPPWGEEQKKSSISHQNMGFIIFYFPPYRFFFVDTLTQNLNMKFGGELHYMWGSWLYSQQGLDGGSCFAEFFLTWPGLIDQAESIPYVHKFIIPMIHRVYTVMLGGS